MKGQQEDMMGVYEQALEHERNQTEKMEKQLEECSNSMVIKERGTLICIELIV